MATSKTSNLINKFKALVPDNQSTFTTSYQVDSSANPVTFSLSFGPPGVAVSTTAKLGSTVLLNATVGSISNTPVGNNSAIAGQFLTLYSIVTVTKATPVPTNLALSFSLDGGVTSYQHSLTQQVNTSGSSVFFKIEVFFFS